ncbi:MAG: polyprenyl synthetase family protein [Actinomycetota bacterium]|nr:polyprenyl synthetase family protein [Actinomycetota bacterium]
MTSSATLEAADPALAAAVLSGLDAVENRLREVVHSSHPLLAEASSHLMLAGGKRVRPLLTLVASHLGDPTSAGIVDAAVVVELTHLATLYHDDVMDEAPVRRGTQSANARWGNTVAILTGDYLFARASDLTAGLGTEVTRLQSQTFARLVEGQIAETAGPGPDEDPVAHHLRVVADKTGSLIATSARLGAMVAGADADDVEAVARFGEVFGVAFQLSDDLIDIASDAADSGKTPGTDLREGVATLPVLLVLAAEEPGDRQLRELLMGDLSDDGRLAEALTGLRSHPAMSVARGQLGAYVEQARDLAGSLSAGPVRAALFGLADLLSARTG